MKRKTANIRVAKSMIKTRPQRRRIVRSVESILQSVINTEEDSLNRYPVNFQESDQYLDGERAIEALHIVLDFLDDVYKLRNARSVPF